MRILVLSLCLIIAAACGKTTSTQQTVKEVPLTEDQLKSALVTQQNTCEGGPCPKGVLRVFTINYTSPSKSGLCTGSYLGNRLVLTNSHCLRLQTDALNCKGFWVSTVNSSYKQYAQCSRIVKRVSSTLINDFALIELDRELHIAPIKISTAPVAPGDWVTPVVIDHDPKTISKSRTLKIDCRVIPQSIKTPEFNNFPILYLENCPLIGGNSGSPILNRNGQMVGMVFGVEVDRRTKKHKYPGSYSTPYAERIVSNTETYGFAWKQMASELKQYLTHAIVE